MIDFDDEVNFVRVVLSWSTGRNETKPVTAKRPVLKSNCGKHRHFLNQIMTGKHVRTMSLSGAYPPSFTAACSFIVNVTGEVTRTERAAGPIGERLVS